MYIFGAGGVGRECLDSAELLDLSVEAFIDDFRAGEVINGVRAMVFQDAEPGRKIHVSLANPQLRQRFAREAEGRGLELVSMIDPRAMVSTRAVVGVGSLICAGAFVSTNVTLGRLCQVHYQCSIGHDTTMSELVTVLPGANISGAVQLGAGVTVGTGAQVLPGLTVADGSFVGAGAVVTKDVPAGVVVAGVPARIMREA